ERLPMRRSLTAGSCESEEAKPRPMREGLLGGVLVTAWPLLDVQERKAKLTYQGIKKFEGREFQVIRYRPKKGTDLAIRLYFEPETLRHAMTTYQVSIQAGIGANDVES